MKYPVYLPERKNYRSNANNSEKLNAVLDMDEGARYLGEFAIGVNPFILHPMKDTLFDEKIMGSIHLTPGRCYEDAFNGNDSQIHWVWCSFKLKHMAAEKSILMMF